MTGPRARYNCPRCLDTGLVAEGLKVRRTVQCPMCGPLEQHELEALDSYRRGLAQGTLKSGSPALVKQLLGIIDRLCIAFRYPPVTGRESDFNEALDGLDDMNRKSRES